MTELLTELIARCRMGEPDAIATLVRRFQPWAQDFACSLLHDADLAEDAVQAAFIRMLARLADLREPQAFPAWLRQILRTECHRRLRVRQPDSLPEEIDPPTTQASPLDEAAAHERVALVRQAMATLSQATRAAAELFYLDQRPCAEVAEMLNVPTGTVKRRLHDARQQLRRALSPLAPATRGDTKPRPQLPL